MSDTKTISSGNVTVNISALKVYEYCLQSTMNTINVVTFLRTYHIYQDKHNVGTNHYHIKLADIERKYYITFSVSNQSLSISINPNAKPTALTEHIGMIDIETISKVKAEYIFNAMVNQKWNF